MILTTPLVTSRIILDLEQISYIEIDPEDRNALYVRLKHHEGWLRLLGSDAEKLLLRLSQAHILNDDVDDFLTNFRQGLGEENGN